MARGLTFAALLIAPVTLLALTWPLHGTLAVIGWADAVVLTVTAWFLAAETSRFSGTERKDR